MGARVFEFLMAPNDDGRAMSYESSSISLVEFEFELFGKPKFCSRVDVMPWRREISSADRLRETDIITMSTRRWYGAGER